MKAHDLPPIIVMRRLTNNPILIKTQSSKNLPIDDVLRFEVSKLPDIMDFDDAQTCLFPPLQVLGPRVISSKFFPTRDAFRKQSKENFQKNQLGFIIFVIDNFSSKPVVGGLGQ